jgi:RHS repeat-associated protein
MYNGKELHSDFGLGMYAYGARYFDPSIGRFIGVDPISDEFPFVTTFNYAENEPIANIDLHGLQKFSVKELGEGE